MRLSLLIMFLQLILTTIINPTLLHSSRTLLKNSQLEFVTSMFKEKQFNDTVENLTIFVDKKTGHKSYKNIFIRDDSSILSPVARSTTTFAKTGYVSKDDKFLILFDGNIQKLNENGEIKIIKFDKISYNFSGISTKSISKPNAGNLYYKNFQVHTR